MSSKSRIRVFRSIGFKIAFWYSLSVICILFFSGTFLYFRLQSKLFKRADRLVLDEAAELSQFLVGVNHVNEELENAIKNEFSDDRYYKLSLRLLDVEKDKLITSGNFVLHKREIPEKVMRKTKAGDDVVFETVRAQGLKYPIRLLTKKIYYGDSLKYILQIAFYLKPLYKAVENLEENLITLVPVFIAVSIAFGWFFAKKSLAPIESITETTRNITATSLGERLVCTNTGDELDKLAKTINLMLDRLEASFARVARFTSDVSHELRTPVASLMTGTEVILSRVRSADEYRKVHEQNLQTLERITRLINDLLELSRSDSDSDILIPESFNLGALLQEIQNTFMPVAHAKEIELVMREMPEVQINGDKMLLRRVFTNILDNAIKYTLPGGSVYLSLNNRHDDVVVRITDTGVGISQDNLEKIFDRFYRIDNSRSRVAGGSGLGLNICKNFVELHKGRIAVKSESGAGSAFEVILPKHHSLGKSEALLS